MFQLQENDLKDVGGGFGGAGAVAGGIAGGVTGGLAGGTVGDANGAAAVGAAVGAACGTAVGSAVGAATGNATAAAAAGTAAGAACATSATGDGGGGGGKVICTELCRNGEVDYQTWLADIQYSRTNFSSQTMRGYHFWGIPYVKLMRKHPAFARAAKYPVTWFAEDIAFRMGVRSKPNLKGWILREIFFRPFCYAIGALAAERDWSTLWSSDRKIA